MRFLVLIAMVVLGGCATTVSENMMPDGNTWRVKVNALDKCSGFSSVESCVDAIRPLIANRGSELCGRRPDRVFGCVKSTAGEIVGVICNVQCNEATTVQIKGKSDTAVASAPPKKIDSDVFQKAKRCQEKGGVWLNDGCQINVE